MSPINVKGFMVTSGKQNPPNYKPVMPPPGDSPLEISPLVLILGILAFLFYAFAWQSILETPLLAELFVSAQTHQRLLTSLGATTETLADGAELIRVPLLPCLIAAGGLIFLIGSLAVIWFAFKCRPKFQTAMLRWLRRAIIWLALPAAWQILWLTSVIINWESSTTLLASVAHFVMAAGLGGMLASIPITSTMLSTNPVKVDKYEFAGIPLIVWCGMLIYLLMFVSMNWCLYWNLMLPHGDSAMYEEHLWNLLSGKGFRSYLDQGLFLGEHIQVIHVLLMPLYIIWPSHLLLELCESLALASCAVPIYWIAKRHLDRAAVAHSNVIPAACLALAWLLYSPLQFIDISVDLKTFRPIAFGIPAFLFAIDQYERGRVWSSSLLLALMLSAKEDYAIVLGCFGLWVCVFEFIQWKWKQSEEETAAKRHQRLFGFGLVLTLLAPVYLWSALKAIVWFRSGVEVHYASYFSRFGESTGEIIVNMLLPPGIYAALLNGSTLLYFIAILVPLAGLPLCSPTRFLTTLPLLALLCLNELSQSPWHHFHAPLLPLLFWAAAAGLGNLKRYQARQRCPQASTMAYLAVCLAFTTGACFTLTPFGIPFWDAGSKWQGEKLYVQGERAKAFAAVPGLIPQEARVASTDFVHPRFTHYARSYDYSDYKRKVAGDTTNVPDDTEYIVIDTQHPYSEIKSPSQVRELREEPERWQLLEHDASDYFIILKKRAESTTTGN